MIVRLVIAITTTMLASSFLPARQIPALSYQELLSQAELVVVARPITAADGSEFATLGDIARVTTTFEIIGTLKGAYARKEIFVSHYRRRSQGVIWYSGYPNATVFERNPERDQAGSPVSAYLLFLKRNRLGRYEFVTGEFDSAFSVRKITSLAK